MTNNVQNIQSANTSSTTGGLQTIDFTVFNDVRLGSLAGAVGVSGFTTNIANGTQISILISDSEGNATTVNVEVISNAFELLNIDTSMLELGNLNVIAIVNDLSVNLVHARDIPQEVTPIAVTLAELDQNNNISIEGVTKGFAPDQVLNLVIRDTNGTKVTATAAVQSGGTFSVSGISTQGLADGTLIIDVLTQTPNGSVSIENADNVQLINKVPAGTDKTLAVNEDAALVLTLADFGYVQSSNFVMSGIKIAGLPSLGTLKINGNALVLDDFVSVAQINSGLLVFQGVQDANGLAYDSFKFKVMDNRPTNNEDPTPNTITFNVTPINDVPVLTTAGAIGTITEDGASATAVNLWSTAPAYAAGPSNESSQTLSYKITAIPAFITLFKADGTTAVTAGSTVTAAEFATLKYKTVDNANGTGSVTFDVIDSGSGTAPNVNTLSGQSVNMTVTAVNDAPVLATGSTLGYTENAAATAINTAITVADADNATLSTATVSITGGFATGQDVLSFANTGAAAMGNIAGSYNATTGVMTLSSSGGTATLAQWQAALRAVAYNNSSDAPSTAARTVSYTVNDGTVNGNTVTSTINVSAVNDAPVLATGSTLGYTENAVATAINTAITVTDADNATLSTATVSITGGFATGQDVLSFANTGAAAMGNIAGSYNATTGVMTLSSAGGTATLAQWQAALRAVAYNNSSDAPSTAARTVSYTVNDGAVNGNTVTSTINVTAVNDAPVLADTALNLNAVIQGTSLPSGPVGVLVSSLVGGVSDVDADAVKGIAITGVNTAKGTLYYSLDGGTNWTALTDASASTARLLKSDSDNRVYFKAAADAQGNVADALTFRAWDTTTGTEGQTANVATNGGITAFSSATDTVSNYVDRKLTINTVSSDDLMHAGEDLVITGKAESGTTPAQAF